MITGFWTSCCIYVAAQLNIADLLTSQPKTAAQLAEETQTHAPSLYRLLRTLSSVGVFHENDKNEFELTAL
ncbi:MAG: methyltransferase family protein, partial [Flavisolibacter sp.]